ncbi:MAG: hypothetical protein ACK5IA_16145 [Cyanobacteriota bacterium]
MLRSFRLILVLLLCNGAALGRPLTPEALSPQAAQAWVGVWALSDQAQQLVNLRLEADGTASTASGARSNQLPLVTEPLTEPLNETLTAADLLERGQWRLRQGGGVEVEYTSGWTDVIVPRSGALVQRSWMPGADRGEAPSHEGPALRLRGGQAEAVGVYRIMPLQAEEAPWLLSLLSSGRAFNTRDRQAAGQWRLAGQRVQIEWSSGWGTRLLARPGGPHPAELWAPGALRRGAPSSRPLSQRL